MFLNVSQSSDVGLLKLLETSTTARIFSIKPLIFKLDVKKTN